jgi:hypothetical protein
LHGCELIPATMVSTPLQVCAVTTFIADSNVVYSSLIPLLNMSLDLGKTRLGSVGSLMSDHDNSVE